MKLKLNKSLAYIMLIQLKLVFKLIHYIVFHLSNLFQINLAFNYTFLFKIYFTDRKKNQNKKIFI